MADVLDPPAAEVASPRVQAAAIEVRAVVKAYGSNIALDSVDLDVPPGSFCVLLGPSGSGKTTLLRCLSGIERITSGRIRLGDRVVADGAAHRPPERRNLAMVFQDYALWPHLTACRNVELALQRRSLGRRNGRVRAGEMLERVGLGHLADRFPNELSGGEQQRVALARALVAETPLLLFDEPLSNLDADLRERMRIEIATLARESGATSVYITHDQAEAFALADSIGVLSGGRLLQLAAPETVYHRPATPFVARFTALAGELPVVVGEAPPEPSADPGIVHRLVHTRSGSGTEPIVAAAPADRPPPARAQATLFVRPAAVGIVAPDATGRHLDAEVVDTAYRGRGYDHAVRLAGGERLIGVHDRNRWTPGTNVGIRLHPSGCLLFGEDRNDG